MDRRTVLKTASGMAAATAFAGCTGLVGDDDSDQERHASLWHARSEAEAETLEDTITQFNDAHEDHHIVTEEVSELEERVETAIPGGDGPELFAWAHDWIGAHHEREFLYDASDDLDVDLEEEFVSTGVDAVTYQGNVYGLPLAGEVPTLMYNKDLVDEPPETFDEMESIMEEHHDPATGQYGFSMAFDPYFVSAFVHGFGGYYFDDDENDLGLELDETHEGIELVRDVLWEYSADDMGYEPQAGVFQDGNAPLAFNGPWAVGDYEDAGIDLGVAPLPELDSGQLRPYTGVDILYFSSMMEENEDHRDTSLEYAQWMTTNGDITLDTAQKHNYLPVQKEYVGHEDLPAEVEAFTETFEMGIPMPTSPEMNDVWVPVEEAIEQVLVGGEPPEDAFGRAAEEIRDGWEEDE